MHSYKLLLLESGLNKLVKDEWYTNQTHVQSPEAHLDSFRWPHAFRHFSKRQRSKGVRAAGKERGWGVVVWWLLRRCCALRQQRILCGLQMHFLPFFLCRLHLGSGSPPAEPSARRTHTHTQEHNTTDPLSPCPLGTGDRDVCRALDCGSLLTCLFDMWWLVFALCKLCFLGWFEACVSKLQLSGLGLSLLFVSATEWYSFYFVLIHCFQCLLVTSLPACQMAGFDSSWQWGTRQRTPLLPVGWLQFGTGCGLFSALYFHIQLFSVQPFTRLIYQPVNHSLASTPNLLLQQSQWPSLRPHGPPGQSRCACLFILTGAPMWLQPANGAAAVGYDVTN